MSECVDCTLKLNVDIMGIGVRAALYAQIILAWFMALKYPETFVKNSRAAYMTATALLVAAFIQWKTQDLSVLDSLVVSLITSMMTIFIVVSGTSRVEAKPKPTQSNQSPSGNASTDPTPASTPPDDEKLSNTLPSAQPAPVQIPQQSTAQPKINQSAGLPVTAPQTAPPTLSTAQQQAAAQASDPPVPNFKPRRSNTQWFIRFCFVNLWGAWSFILWKDPVHFGLKGPRANCTTNYDVVIWVFGEELQAVSTGIRIAALVLCSILYFIAIFSLFFTLEDVVEPIMGLFGSITEYFTAGPLKRGNTTPRATPTRLLHEDPVINGIHYLLHLFAFGTLLYLLVATEMTIRSNDKEKATMQWSYGQIIALILLLQQFNDLCSTIIEGREEKERKREQEEIAKRRARPRIDTNQQQDISMKDLTPVPPNPDSLPV